MLPGGKSARKAFLLPQGKRCSAKMRLEPAKPVLRIVLKGVASFHNPLVSPNEV